VYKVTAFYWLLQELVGNWKSGKRLTLDQKAQLIQLLVWNLTRLEQEQAAYDEYESDIMIPGVEAFTENEIRRQGFDDPRKTIPHPVDIHDVALCETSDEEEYDTSVSCETTEQIAQLVLACKELQLKVADNLSERESREIK
jgi:ribosomal protein L24